MDVRRLAELVVDVPVLHVLGLVAILLVIGLCALRGLHFKWINSKRWLGVGLIFAAVLLVTARIALPNRPASDTPYPVLPLRSDVPNASRRRVVELMSATSSGSSLMVTGMADADHTGAQATVYRRAAGRGQAASSWRRSGAVSIDSDGRFSGSVPVRDEYEQVDQMEVTIVLATAAPPSVLSDAELGRYWHSTTRLVTVTPIGVAITAINERELGTFIDLANVHELLVGGGAQGLVAGLRTETLWVRLEGATGCAHAEAERRGSAAWLARMPLPAPLPRTFALSLSISSLRPDCERPPLGAPVRCSVTSHRLVCNPPVVPSGSTL